MGLETVAGTRDNVEAGTRVVELLGTARIVHRHHKVGIALHDEHGSLILADEVKGSHVVDFLEEASAHLHAP